MILLAVQVVRELKRTIYKPKMAVLVSCHSGVQASSDGPCQATKPLELLSTPSLSIDVELLSLTDLIAASMPNGSIASRQEQAKRQNVKIMWCLQGARPHYCINQSVIRKGNIDAECEELNKDGMGCKYKKNVPSISHRLVQASIKR